MNLTKYVTKTNVCLFSVMLFLLSLLFGETLDFYSLFSWWDLMLHGGVAFVLSIVFIKLIDDHAIVDAKNSFIVPFFVLMAVMGVEATWEVFEYLCDMLFNWNMMKSGLDDTMGDIIVTLIASRAALMIQGGFPRWIIRKFKNGIC